LLLEGLSNIVRLEIRIAFEDLLDRCPMGNLADDDRSRDAQPPA
jgi:hypothetical protein